MDEKMKSKLVYVIRKRDEIITVKLIFEKKIWNVVSVYDPQVKKEDKEIF